MLFAVAWPEIKKKYIYIYPRMNIEENPYNWTEYPCKCPNDFQFWNHSKDPPHVIKNKQSNDNTNEKYQREKCSVRSAYPFGSIVRWLEVWSDRFRKKHKPTVWFAVISNLYAFSALCNSRKVHMHHGSDKENNLCDWFQIVLFQISARFD